MTEFFRDFPWLTILIILMAVRLYNYYFNRPKEITIEEIQEFDAKMRQERFKRGENATWSHKDYD